MIETNAGLKGERRWLVLAVLMSITAQAQAQIDLRSATVQDINRAFEAGTLTSEELVRRYLARIEADNLQGPTLRAVVSKEAGAIIIGKGNLDEFNLGSMGLSSIAGQTLNPYELTRNPGGSSAGPGVSVTVGFAAIGIGTETGASIRSPSSNSSLVGLAPTQGLISRAGLLPISYTQDRAGPMARSVWGAARHFWPPT